MTKLNNSKFYKSQKLKIWQNSKTQNVTRLKNENCGKTQKLKKWENSKNKIETKQNKNSKCDETQKF